VLPPGPEISRYLYDVCERFQILDKIQLNTSVRNCRWVNEDEEWEVILDHLAPGVGDMGSTERAEYEQNHGEKSAVLHSEKIRTKLVVSACGGLVEPKAWKNLPGLESFEGDIMHTARWDHSVDLRDKNVVVVGTGCSAIQVVPQLIKPHYGVKRITQLMRSPPWMVPFLPDEARERWKSWMPWLSTYVPGFQKTFRKFLFSMFEAEWYALFSPTEKAREARRKKATDLMDYMRRTAPEKYQDILTPNYEVFCKRRIVDDGWYKSLNDQRVELTTQPLKTVNEKTITIGPGRHYPPPSNTEYKHPTEEREIPADVIIMANGYETNSWLHPLEVYGKDGQSMEKVWQQRGGAQAYMGLAMDGFPNFFLIFGPNTATGHTSVILATENAVNYTLKFVKGVIQGDVSTWDVKESAERAWTERVQSDLKNSLYSTGGCRNWYVNASGWNSSTYPRSQIDASLRHMFPVWSHWDGKYTRKGLFNLYFGRLLKLMGLVSLLFALVYRIQYGGAALNEKLIQSLRQSWGQGNRMLASISARFSR
jgi:cation diffusion facilitator CzcD-associated flavoprotein CzcO